jgi:hypothetical protein
MMTRACQIWPNFTKFVVGTTLLKEGHFCLYLQNSLIQTSQTGGWWYSDTSPFSIPCLSLCLRVLIQSPLTPGERKYGGEKQILESETWWWLWPSSNPWPRQTWRRMRDTDTGTDGCIRESLRRQAKPYWIRPGAKVIRLFCPQFTSFRNKLECLLD